MIPLRRLRSDPQPWNDHRISCVKWSMSALPLDVYVVQQEMLPYSYTTLVRTVAVVVSIDPTGSRCSRPDHSLESTHHPTLGCMRLHPCGSQAVIKECQTSGCCLSLV